MTTRLATDFLSPPAEIMDELGDDVGHGRLIYEEAIYWRPPQTSLRWEGSGERAAGDPAPSVGAEESDTGDHRGSVGADGSGLTGSGDHHDSVGARPPRAVVPNGREIKRVMNDEAALEAAHGPMSVDGGGRGRSS